MPRQCHRLVPEKVVHTFSDCALHQFKTPIEVTYLLLTRDDMRYRMPLASKYCFRRSYTTMPILTEPYFQRRH
jgi:hypothetical protein